jgi:hypothetical protein
VENGDAVLQEVRERDVVQYLPHLRQSYTRKVNIHTTETRPMTQLSQSELEAIVIEDISKLDHVRIAMEPIISRVAEFDPILADEMRKVLDV